jgi:hypothetical protein
MLVGLVPRMHTLGRVLRLARGDECLGYFGHWMSDDAQLFAYEDPIALAPGDRLTLSCTYDTTSRDAAVQQGESVDDEECVAYLAIEAN